MIPSITRWFIRIQLAEEMLTQIDGLADAAAAAIGQHPREGLAVDLDAGHAAAEGVFVWAGGVVGVGAEHGCMGRFVSKRGRIFGAERQV